MKEEKALQELTTEQVACLNRIGSGADVLDYCLAKKLREVHKICPDLLIIGDHKGYYHVGDKVPYFGACPTKKGVEYLEQKKHEQKEAKKPDV